MLVFTKYESPWLSGFRQGGVLTNLFFNSFFPGPHDRLIQVNRTIYTTVVQVRQRIQRLVRRGYYVIITRSTSCLLRHDYCGTYRNIGRLCTLVKTCRRAASSVNLEHHNCNMAVSTHHQHTCISHTFFTNTPCPH